MWRTRSFRGKARIGVGTAIAMAGAAVAACSSNGVPTLPAFDRAKPPPLLFAVDIASGGLRFAIPQTSTTQRLANLVVSDGVIVAEAYNCAESGATSIQAFDADDGALKWTYTSPAGPELGFDNITVVDGVVVFSLDEYQVASTAIALDLDSGKTRWTRTFTGTASVHASGVAPGTVIGADQHEIVGLDRQSGKQLWTVDDPTDMPYFTVLDPSGLMTVRGFRLIDMATGRDPWPSTMGTGILF
ncbi:MAG: PQQ-binding-like beta-propeller repeat protein, partial [Acidimicrobiia bacterium]